MGKPLHWIVILQLVSSTFAYRYDSWYRVDTQRPVDVITDVVNDLGVKILQQYATHGNVAFSPMGVAFVLAALYEGSAGRGSQQIAEALGLPNRDVTRIGFRDIHRRLRTYLNADGFLGGLTLSQENIQLRPEYEDILRFYGFDLSSIRQETNVTVSMGDSPVTTELTMSTVGLTTSPVETTNTENVLDMTTMLTGAVTTLPSATAETTMVPSIATDTTQQTVTISMNADMQTTLNPVTSSETVVENTLPTQPVNSAVISGESVQPSPSADAESVAGLPNTVTPAISTGQPLTTVMDSQTSTSTLTMIFVAGTQSPQTSPTIAASTSETLTTEAVTNTVVPSSNTENIGNTNSNAPETPSASIKVPMGVDTTMAVTADDNATISMDANTEVPSTFATNSELPMTTNVPSSAMTVDTSTEVLAAASTIVANMMPPNTSATSNLPIPVTPITLDNANITIPSPVTEMVMNNSIISQPNTETPISVNTSVVNTPEVITMNDFITTPITNIDNDTTAEVSTESATMAILSTQAINMISNNLTGNSDNFTITNSTMDSMLMDNQTVANSTINSMPMDNQTDANSTINSMSMSNQTAVNSTINSPSMNNQTAVNSMINSMLMDNQTVASLVDENTISMNRKKKAIEIETNESGSNLKNIINDNTINDKSTSRLSSFRKRRKRSPRGYFSSYPDEGVWMQDLEIWKSYGTQNLDESYRNSAEEISFLVNGCDISSVSASRYIAVLPFAYFPLLHAVALEFPLDDPRYNIILLMPTDKTDTHRLARDLSGKSLRSLRKRLQPTWVRATIPSFMLHGFVTLTSFLQRLGILDVFEPRVADLSPMTSDLGVYARDVQQSIGVNIRNYMKSDRTHSRESSNVVPPRRDYYRYLHPGNGLFERAGPVPFTALHPFLYFIVDAETSVSLIIGRIDDPLNSRIL